MKIQQALAQQFGFMYRVVAANLSGMTSSQSLAKPAPGGNCANWILGHLTNIQNSVMGLIGEEPVWQTEQLTRAGYEPIQSPADALDWETMRDRFIASGERCTEAISRLSSETLLETVPAPFGGTCTRAELLTTLSFHQSYHAGQLALCRRIAGMEGAIKMPGQVQTA